MDKQPSYDESAGKLDHFRALASDQFGDEALYLYEKRDPENSQKKIPFVLTLDEAIEICGSHMTEASDEDFIGMLHYMRSKAVAYESRIANESAVALAYDEARQRGLARHALKHTD